MAIKNANDGLEYLSKADKNGYKWVLHEKESEISGNDS